MKNRKWANPETDLLSLFTAGMDRPVMGLRPPQPGVQLNLGAGYKFIGGTEPLGMEQGWRAGTPLPYDTATVGAIWTFHFFEHLTKDEFLNVLRECERVLVGGAPLNIVLPHWKSEGAFHDLDHKQFFGESTWKNLMFNDYYDGTMPRVWQFNIGLNLIMGLNERNLALVTQLIRSPR